MRSAVVVVACVVAVAFVAVAVWAYTPDADRGAIEAKYGVGPGDYLDAPGVRLRFRDSGPRGARTVIFLHGFGSSLETWDAWAGALARDLRIIRFDWPGFALSSTDAANDYTDARSIDVLESVMDRLGVAEATLVGNSMGGKIAWMFAARHPNRVRQLVLVSPDGFASAGFEYGKHADIPAVVRLLPYVLPRALVRMSLRPAFGNPAALTDRLVDRYRDFMRLPGIRSAMVARMSQVVLQPPEPLLKQIAAPTLLLWGERDGMIPFANAADYLRNIPGAKLVALPGVGHVPQEEAPAESLEPLRAFLLH